LATKLFFWKSIVCREREIFAIARFYFGTYFENIKMLHRLVLPKDVTALSDK
jgi:hypothetical protein